MAGPNTKNWKAVENRQPPQKEPKLTVTGDVETSNSNQTPYLKEAEPQGTNPAILILDLTIATSGAGNPVMGWKTAKFEKNVNPGQYSSVDIHSDHQSVGQAKVEVVH